MTQEDKDLLLKDLCARLPYGTMCYNSETESNFKLCDVADIDSGYPTFDYGYGQLETVKPYLRPMSSMTEEEKEELKCIFDAENITNDSICFLEGGTLEEYEAQIPFSFCSKLIDWLNAHHFDYRGLIEKGLAIEVTKENNPYKE